VDAAFWPSFIANAQAQSVRATQSYPATAQPSAGYLLNTPLAASASQSFPQTETQQQAAQTVFVSAYPPPYAFLNSPAQQQKANYLGYAQLAPSFQALNYDNNPFVSSFPPRHVIPANYSKGLNVSASQSIPISGLYPALQSAYFPSSLTLPPSWPSLTLSGLEQSASNSAAGFSHTPLYQPAANTGSLNTIRPLTFDGIYQSQQGTNSQFPVFPLTAYSQDYAQLGLPKYTHAPYGTNRGNSQRANKLAQTSEHKTFREPSAKGRYQYSSKYSSPGPDSDDNEAYRKKTPQELDDSDDAEEVSKSSASYKKPDTAHKSNHKDADDDDNDYKNSSDFVEYKKRPQVTASSDDDDDDDDDEPEETSVFPSKSCNFFDSSPSKAASSHSSSFSDGKHNFDPANFEEQFKAFASNDNFKAPDFNAESSKTVNDYYANPLSSNEKRLRMLYTQRSKVTDSYMTPSEKRETEIPKTLHYYNYKAPQYAYFRTVDYFPNSPFKESPEQTRTQTSQHPPADRDEGHEEAEGDESATSVVARRNKMHR
jgi:hypothetical protein